MGEQDSKVEMEKEGWFKTTCRLMNKVLEQQGSLPDIPSCLTSDISRIPA